MGQPDNAGEDFTDAHSTADAHHHTPQESTPSLGLSFGYESRKEADTGVGAQAVLKAVWDGEGKYHLLRLKYGNLSFSGAVIFCLNGHF